MRPSRCQATVVSRLLRDATALRRRCSAAGSSRCRRCSWPGPGDRQAWPKSAACWSPAMPAIGNRAPSRRGRVVAEDAARRRDLAAARRAGCRSSAQQLVVPVAGVDVEEQRAGGVATRRCTCTRAAGELPDEPACRSCRTRARRARARARAPATWSRSQRELGAGEIGVEHEAGLARESSARGPRARSASHSGRGAPVLPDDRVGERARRSRGPRRTVVSRWLVMPMAATSRGARRGALRERLVQRRPTASPRSPSASCSTQPGCGKIWRNSCCADRAHACRRGRRRWRASWWCPDRARGRRTCSVRARCRGLRGRGVESRRLSADASNRRDAHRCGSPRCRRPAATLISRMPCASDRSARAPALPRRCTFDGFQREDGLFDIEAHLVDVKDHDYRAAAPACAPAPAVPVHDMWVRVTIERVRRSSTRRHGVGPTACRTRAVRPHRARLPQARRRATSSHGFRKRAARASLGGAKGCTHITEMLGELADGGDPDASPGCSARTTRRRQKPFQLDRATRSSTTTRRPCSATIRRWYRDPRDTSRSRRHRHGGDRVKIHEYQGKELFRKFGMPVPRGIPAFTRRRGGEGREARSAARCGSSRRRSTPAAAARAAASRSRKSIDEVRAARERDPRHAARHAPDRPGGPEGAPAADRGGRRHQEGALRRHGGRPRHAARRADGELRRRHGHRARRGDARRRRSTRSSSIP